MIDILFVAHNRLEFTRQSFEALLANTNWALVRRLFIADDASSDGTEDYLSQAPLRAPVDRTWHEGAFGGPVAAMNWYLARGSSGVEVFAKVDNDIIVCPGWLDDMWQLAVNRPEFDALGIEPNGSAPARCPRARAPEAARHIGGIGLIRRRAFNVCQPRPNGRFGWTEFQNAHDHFAKAWARPPLLCFSLDRLPGEPWAGLAAEYVARGWQRPWPDDWSKEPLPPAYYAWWQPV